MQSPLNASATSAGSLFSGSVFEVPPYQREYAWDEGDVADFWTDLQSALSEDSYFLGLLILTEEGGRKHVVDGQQRILTLTLLATAIYHHALLAGRKALADRINSDFLTAIDYDTDKIQFRVVVSDETDNATLQSIIRGEHQPVNPGFPQKELDDFSPGLYAAYDYIYEKLTVDLSADPFKRLGAWTDFITNRLYFAVFVHPDSSSAYRVFEVINTRGKELTTADLLKNYVLSETPSANRAAMYDEWQAIARSFSGVSSVSLVQYIRHVVTVKGGYILPKDLFDFISGRQAFGSRKPPSIDELMQDLKGNLPVYLQMADQTLEGPASFKALKIFSALNQLGVVSVRPILLALLNVPNSDEGMEHVLRLVLRRIVTGNLGTGNVERILSEAARLIHENGDWSDARVLLDSLNPTDESFLEQVKARSFNKGVLSFLRRSIVQRTTVPDGTGVLHFIAPRYKVAWEGLSEEQVAYWGGTVANTILTDVERRPKQASSWEGVKSELIVRAVEGELVDALQGMDQWNESAVEEISSLVKQRAAEIWC